ncbi:MAG TPA: hypothetical protein VFQ79_08345 [Bryobacteraceae bacterium]|nr:hypothetical protein [Bryobacteraceae bacterium]
MVADIPMDKHWRCYGGHPESQKTLSSIPDEHHGASELARRKVRGKKSSVHVVQQVEYRRRQVFGGTRPPKMRWKGEPMKLCDDSAEARDGVTIKLNRIT